MSQQVKQKAKVVSVSDNTNSFGLHGVIIMTKGGGTWELGIGSLYLPKKGDEITIRVWAQTGNLAGVDGITYEIPRRLGNAPDKVIAEVWGK